MKSLKVLLAAAAVTAVGVGSAAAGTLDDVKAKGFVQCGVSTGVPGFAFTDDAGNWQGFDPAFAFNRSPCRSRMAAENRPNRARASCGPGLASG